MSRVIVALLALASCLAPGDVPECDASKGRLLSRVDGEWRCGDRPDGAAVALARLATQPCADRQVLAFIDGAWACATDGQIAAGTADVSTTAAYADPTWISGLSGSKVTGDVPLAAQVSGAFAGDVGGTAGQLVASRLQGRPLGTQAPATAQVLAWTGSAWEAHDEAMAAGDVRTVEVYSNPAWLASLDAAKIDGAVPSTISFSGHLAGDVTGVQSATTVAGIDGRPIGTNAPDSGQILKWTGSQWEASIDARPGLAGDGTANTAARADHLHTGFVTQAEFAEALKCPRVALPDGTVRRYEIVPGAPVGLVCRSGADEVVRVGSFWIDRYEALVVDRARFNGGSCDAAGVAYGSAGGATPVDDYPASFPDNGQWTSPLFACSSAGAVPSRKLTWFQADQACAQAGKRLCRNAEWQAAAADVPDPGESSGAGGACVTSHTGPRATGGGTGCRSASGVEDLVGNLAEWTGDWWQAGRGALATDGALANPWPAGFSGDATWNVHGSSQVAAFGPGSPAVALRGGYWNDGTNAGAFSLGVASSPADDEPYVGFRCCIGGR